MFRTRLQRLSAATLATSLLGFNAYAYQFSEAALPSAIGVYFFTTEWQREPFQSLHLGSKRNTTGLDPLYVQRCDTGRPGTTITVENAERLSLAALGREPTAAEREQIRERAREYVDTNRPTPPVTPVSYRGLSFCNSAALNAGQLEDVQRLFRERVDADWSRYHQARVNEHVAASLWAIMVVFAICACYLVTLWVFRGEPDRLPFAKSRDTSS